MADSLRTRVARVIAGGAHALLDKLEDVAPVAVLEQSVREVEKITDDVRSELGRVVAHRHLAQQQHRHLNQEHDGLSTALTTALTTARDDLAKPAIARQLDIEAQLPVLEASLSRLSSEEKELAGFVDALLGKRREMEQGIRDLELSRRMAERTVGTPVVPGQSMEARVRAAESVFDRTYQRQTGLGALGGSTSLQQASQLRELGDLTRDKKINERLALLKANE